MAEATGHGYPAMVPAVILAGVGVFTAMPAVQTAAVGAVPPSLISRRTPARAFVSRRRVLRTRVLLEGH
jgi:hypothetical protein